ncbi:hypothetical protein IFO70_07910 [Phormidium tenue FACHB-886]|nr:hypothetical protein [Phormidium tenue FACHB-886]
MVSDRKDTSRMVKFAATEADQILLNAVEQKLAEQSIGFSDFCKQALQQFLQPPEPALAPPTAALQQQILDLQVQMARLEGKEEARQRYALRRLEQQVKELGDRLASLERKEYLEQQVRQLTDRLMRLETPNDSPAQPSPKPEPEVKEKEVVDPLLDRLAPLLEDF